MAFSNKTPQLKMDRKITPQLKNSMKTFNFNSVNVCHPPSKVLRRRVTNVNGIKVEGFFRRNFS